MSFRVLIYHDLPETFSRRLRDNGIELVRGESPTEEGICRDIVDCDALIAFEQPENGFNKRIMDAGKRLKLIARRGVGYETVDVNYATEKGILVTNTAGANSTSVAEATILLMLEAVRNAQKNSEAFRRDREKHVFFNATMETRGIELRGKTLGLVGCGNIGREVGRMANEGFDMKVIGYDPFLRGNLPCIELRGAKEEVFSEADIVSLHLPSTPETISSIGMDLFRLMKPGAYLINASRGNIVVESELIEALQQRIIRGAGLDVYAHEPISQESYALFDFDRVALSPHNAAFTMESYTNGFNSVIESILEVASGIVPRCCVNPNAIHRQF